MRNVLVLGVAVVSFALGAWSAPMFTAKAQEAGSPVFIDKGYVVQGISGEGWRCIAAAVHGNWVRCQDGTWRNVATGVGLQVRAAR